MGAQGVSEFRLFKALPHGKVAKALATVRGSTGSDGVRLSFEFIVLTAARSGEVRGALWEEINEEAGVWRVPGSRSKTGRSHRVPLSRRALEVLDEARETRSSGRCVAVVARCPRERGARCCGA